MGLQLKSRWAGGAQVTRFVDVQHLQAAVINEAYTCFQVRFYLAFVLARQRTLDVAFRGHEPRLPVLQSVYAGIQNVLFGEGPSSLLTQERYDEALSVGRKQLREYRHGLRHGGAAASNGTHSRTPYAARLWAEGVVGVYGGGDDTTGATAYVGGLSAPVFETQLDRWAAADAGEASLEQLMPDGSMELPLSPRLPQRGPHASPPSQSL